MTWYVGDSPTLSYVVTVNDVPTDATVTVDVTAPDGTITSYGSPAHPGTGMYEQSILVDQAGQYVAVWHATGGATDTSVDILQVEATSPGYSDARRVRLLIADLDDPPLFSDADIEEFLTLEGGYVRLAAATALDTIAVSETLVSKRIRTLDLQTDGPAVAKALHDQAKSLREQHASALEDSDSVFETTTLLGIPGFGTAWSPELTEG